jgi:hypothetical protein
MSRPARMAAVDQSRAALQRLDQEDERGNNATTNNHGPDDAADGNGQKDGPGTPRGNSDSGPGHNSD